MSDSLRELMARDPIGYNRKDIDTIITFYRDKLKAWTLGSTMGAKSPAKVVGKVAETHKAIASSDLDI